MWNLQARWQGPDLVGDGINRPADPAEARMHTMFMPLIGKQLHTDANAEQRALVHRHMLLERIEQARYGGKAVSAIGEGALTGQNKTVGSPDVRRVLTDLDRALNIAVIGGMFDRFGNRAQIARAIINHNHRHGAGCCLVAFGLLVLIGHLGGQHGRRIASVLGFAGAADGSRGQGALG